MIQRTIKLHTGVEKTLNSTKIITKTEWQKAAEKLYGSDAKQWRFKCPICGHTASVQEIMSAGAKDPNCAYMECIGRYQKDIGCNFAAYRRRVLLTDPKFKTFLTLAKGAYADTRQGQSRSLYHVRKE